MGTDTLLAVLSDQPQHLSGYFKQLFAQVTNPDRPIRGTAGDVTGNLCRQQREPAQEDPLTCHSVALKATSAQQP